MAQLATELHFILPGPVWGGGGDEIIKVPYHNEIECPTDTQFIFKEKNFTKICTNG